MRDEEKSREQLISEIKLLRRRVSELEKKLVEITSPNTDRECGEFSSQLTGGALSGRETIMVVEDDDQVRSTVMSMIQLFGYNAVEAENAEAAFDILKEKGAEIDLMLTDIMMPGVSGGELVKMIQPLEKNLKIIFMSGFADSSIVPNDVFDVLESGASFIEKPFSAEDLAKKIRSELDAVK